ncbi:PREDICTED: actin-binding Rho-activating protein [Nanorana parkeri]|uniref:actin-binding Rho-activating protein n=1 Tax=Nanorana parkeri TaxID=125878 RepID=UPI000854CF6C|nr:PREDICTED: actin-binding Rho-activating protein [Nanorana parkeri]
MACEKTMKPAQRAIRKIKTASLVSSLTRGWQQWATEQSTKQEQEPSGWMPTTDDEIMENHCLTLKVKLKAPVVVEPRKEVGSPSEESKETHIKTKSVTKSFASKAQEKGMDIGYLTERYEKDPSTQKYDELMMDKLLQANTSPTRRRKCSNLVSQLTKSWKQIEHDDEGTETSSKTLPKLAKCRSESLETEDSGYGENEEVKPEKEKIEIIEEKKKDTEEKEEDTARIKRSYNSLNNKTVTGLNKINKAYKRCSQVNNIKGRWEKWSDDHTETQKLNPFSDEFDHKFAMSQRLQKGDQGYGRPKEGTKTAERAMRAEAHIHREMRDLCFIISTIAEPGRDGKMRVTFGELFDRYVRISDKVVGILLRARKHGMVDFLGEMLWQGRDDDVIITLI